MPAPKPAPHNARRASSYPDSNTGVPAMAGAAPDEYRCKATKKSGGDRCGQWRLQGQEVCKYHGGSSPQALAAARRRIEHAKTIERADTAARRLGLPVDVDPQQALLDELHQTAGICAWLRTHLDTRLDTTDEATVVDSAEWRAWHQQREHLTTVATACLRAGIAERQVRLAEQQGALLADVIRRIFDDPDLGLTERQKEAAPRVARRHLTVAATA